MSAIETATEAGAAGLYIESEDRLSLWNMPFSGWTVLQLATSSLAPQKVQLRPIEDKGSIAESLTAAKVNVLERVPAQQMFFVKALRNVALFAAGFFTILPSATMGVCYHGFKMTQHLFLALKQESKTNDNWEKVRKHASRLIRDLLPVAITVGIAMKAVSSAAPAFAGAALVGSIFASAILFAPYPLFHQMPAGWLLAGDKTFLPTLKEAYGFHKSLILRREFGLVGSPEGHLLSWDPEKDWDLGLDLIFNRSVTGYFGRLYRQKGNEFREAVKALEVLLPKECQTLFLIDCWHNTKKAFDLVKKNQSTIALSPAEIEEKKQKILSSKIELSTVRSIMTQAMKFSGYREDNIPDW